MKEQDKMECVKRKQQRHLSFSLMHTNTNTHVHSHTHTHTTENTERPKRLEKASDLTSEQQIHILCIRVNRKLDKLYNT